MDFLREVENKLDLPDDEKSQVLKELQSHYCDLMDEYTASGMSEDEAAVKAAQKMGDPADIARRTQSSHWGTTWKSAILAALPLLIFSLPLLWEAPTGTIIFRSSYWMLPVLIIAAVMLAESITELIHNRRPVWLATWLPVSISQFIGGTVSLYAALNEQILIDKKFLPVEFPEYFNIVALTNIIVWGLFTLWLYRDSIKQQVTTGVIFVLAMAIIIARQKYGWWIGNINADMIRTVIISLITAPFILMIGIRLFSLHPYGNAALASLFMFAMYGHTQTQPHWGIGATGSTLNTISHTIMVIIPALTILLYVRICRWSTKLLIIVSSMALSTGLPLSIIFILVSTLIPVNPGMVSFDIAREASLASCFNILSIMLVLTPLIIYKQSHNRKPVPVS